MKGAIHGRDRKGPNVQLVLDDIWTCWKKLTDDQQLPQIMMVRSDISSIPMLHPSEDSDQTRDERLHNLEQILSILVLKNQDMCEQITSLSDMVKKNSEMHNRSEGFGTAVSVDQQKKTWADRLGRARDKTIERIQKAEVNRSQFPKRRRVERLVTLMSKSM